MAWIRRHFARHRDQRDRRELTWISSVASPCSEGETGAGGQDGRDGGCGGGRGARRGNAGGASWRVHEAVPGGRRLVLAGEAARGVRGRAPRRDRAQVGGADGAGAVRGPPAAAALRGCEPLEPLSAPRSAAGRGGGGTGRSGGRAGGGWIRDAEEGHRVGRGRPPVVRETRQGRELPGRGLPRVRRQGILRAGR